MKKIIFVCLFITVSVFAQAAEDKVVAIVNNEIITSVDVNTFLKFMYMQLSSKYKGKELEEKIQSMKPDVVNRLIEDRLLVQEAKNLGIKVDSNRIEARIGQMKSNYPSEAIFIADLQKNGLTLYDVENKIRDQIIMYDLVEYKVRRQIQANPNDVTKAYNERAGDFTEPEKRKIAAVRTDDESKIKQVLSQVKLGKSFEEAALAAELTVDDLGVVSRDQLKDELGVPVFSLSIGEVSVPIKIENKFYLIKLEEIIAAKQMTLDESTRDITDALLEEKMQVKMTEFMDELKKKSYIEIKKDY